MYSLVKKKCSYKHFVFILVSVVWLRIRIRVWLWARVVIKVILFIQSFNSFFPFLSVALICLAYLSGMSNDCWLFCCWGYWKFCVSGYWLFCGWGCWRVMAVGIEYFGGTFLVGSAYHHPSLLHALPQFLQMGQCGPHEHFSVACLGITMAWGITATWGGSSVLIVGSGCNCWSMGVLASSFLVSNRFSDVDPELGQGVLCLGWDIAFIFQWWRVGSFILGSSWWTWDLSKLSQLLIYILSLV